MISCHNRYAKAIARNRDLFNTNKSILEIGQSARGIANFLNRPTAGANLKTDSNQTIFLPLQKDNVFNLEFSDNSYDYVVCIDILDQINSDFRADAIREMLRVTRERLIISCPCERVSYNHDRHFSNVLKKSNHKIPKWLSSHIKNGLPEVSDILKILTDLGMSFTVTGNEGIMQHYAGLLLDIQFPKTNKVYQSHKNKTYYSAPITSSEWDRYYSYLFEISKNEHYNIKTNHRPSNIQSSDNNNIAIYSVFHKDIDTSYLNKIIPIYTGNIAKQKEHAYITDRLNNSPSLLNTRWSELSAIYKIWKEGPQTDIVGFTHYRRLFNFNRQNDKNIVISRSNLKENYINDTYDLDYIKKLTNKDICIAKPIKLETPIWEQYFNTHNTNDWCWVLSKLSKNYPHLMRHALEQSKSTSLYACNMFITKWPTFCELCSLWFDILLEFESNVPPERANTYQNRDISFMAERIFDIWIRYKKFSGEIIRELPIFFIEFENDNKAIEVSTARNHYIPEQQGDHHKKRSLKEFVHSLLQKTLWRS